MSQNVEQGTRRIAALAAALLLVGCADIQTTVRTERGPTLRFYDREAGVQRGGVTARVEPSWPSVTLRFSRFELCRSERVEEFLEERITERGSPSAGPALGSGISTSALGAALLLGQGLFSEQRTPDAEGRRPLSDRQVARAWGISLLALGVPAILTGAISLAQTGESVEPRKLEQVVSAKERPCGEKPAEGQVELLGPRGSVPVGPTREGAVVLTAEALRGVVFNDILLDERPVQLAAADEEALDAFRACVHVLGLEPLTEGPTPLLQERLQRTRQCRPVAGAAADEAAGALEAELTRRREAGEAHGLPATWTRWEEARAALAPKLLVQTSEDLAPLLQLPEGTAVVLRGRVAERTDPNLLVFELGTARAWLFVERPERWGEQLRPGAAVDVLAVLMGTQAMGELAAPLLRAEFVRPSEGI